MTPRNFGRALTAFILLLILLSTLPACNIKWGMVAPTATPTQKLIQLPTATPSKAPTSQPLTVSTKSDQSARTPSVTAVLLSQDIVPSGKEQIVSWKDQVKVTVPAGVVDNKQTLTISEAPALPQPTFKGLVELGSGFDISMGEAKEFNKDLIIEIAYDPAKIKSDLPPEKALVAMYWDPAQNIWIAEPSVVDTQRRVVIIRTNHLSVRQTFWIPSGWTTRESKHFIVIYDPKDTFESLEVSQSARLKGTRVTYTKPMEQLATTISSDLEHAWDEYDKYKFIMPLGDSLEEGRIWVWLDSSAKTASRARFSDDLTFTAKYDDTQYKTGGDQLRHEAAHELFHGIQNRYHRLPGMSLRRWWMEATADYVADAIAWGGAGTMPLVPTTYLSQPITTVDDKHEYKTSRFVAYLARPAGSFKAMWEYVKNQSSNVPAAIDEYLKKERSSSLQKEFRDFVAYVMFDARGPLSPTLLKPEGEVPAMDKGLLNSPAVEQADTLDASKTELSHRFRSLGDYTANVWGIRVIPQAGQQQRKLNLEITGALPSSSLVADVYILKNDFRPDGGVKVEGTLSSNSPKMELRPLDKDDVVYIIAVNASSVDQSLTVKVSDAPAGKWVRVGRIESVEPSKDGPLSKGPFPTSATISGNSATVISQKSYSVIVDKVAKEALLAASRWTGDWSEPPQEMVIGQKWNGKVTLVDAGSQAPLGGYRLNGSIRIFWLIPSIKTSASGDQILVDISSAVPAQGSQVNSRDFSWTIIGPAASGTPPQQMSIFVDTAAFGRNTGGGDDSLYATTARVEYKYELRP